jgi:hypothetical protein
LLDCGVNLLRSAVWSHEEMTLYQMGSGIESEKQPAQPEPEIATGRLSDLVDLSLEQPGQLPEGLEEGRNRMKKGDQAYLIREKVQIPLVAWTGTRNLVELIALNPDHRNSFAHPALTVYECRVMPGVDPSLSYRKLLLFLGSQAESQDRNLQVCCSAAQSRLRAELERQGFWPKYRITRRRFFHWIRRDCIRALPMGGGGLVKNDAFRSYVTRARIGFRDEKA